MTQPKVTSMDLKTLKEELQAVADKFQALNTFLEKDASKEVQAITGGKDAVNLLAVITLTKVLHLFTAYFDVDPTAVQSGIKK